MKKPISVALSPDVIKAMDQAHGNRSAYIEWLIREDLELGYKPANKPNKESSHASKTRS